MKKAAAIILRVLIVCACFYILGAIILYLVVSCQMRDTSVDVDDSHVRFALQLLDLDVSDEIEFEHSYKAAGSWGGDYEIAFAVRLDTIAKSKIRQTDGFMRGDRLGASIREVIQYTMELADHERLQWLPTLEQIFTSDYYVYPVSHIHSDIYPDSAHLMLIRPADEMVFYFAARS